MTNSSLPSAPAAPCARSVGEPAVTGRRPIAIVGAGRLGTALARELARVGHDVRGPLSRDYSAAAAAGAEIVLLCVPDREIAAAAATWQSIRGVQDGETLLGHCSGATDLSVLPGPGGTQATFLLHPLMTFASAGATPAWAGAAAAVAGSTAAAEAAASALATDLGLTPVTIADADRVTYHAAACVASNFLVTLLSAAESLGQTSGLDREMLAPLVRATVENWIVEGAGALTGPIARGDEATVQRQREAVAARTPGRLALFDALTTATRGIAAAPATAELAA